MTAVTEVFLITGFLGAGKTSFLQHVLETAPPGTGVLVNEFGKVSIDGQRLSEQGREVVELNNGSIFCSCLKDNFISALESLIQQERPLILIESSGLADPSAMGAIVELIRRQITTPFQYRGSICLVDGLYFEAARSKMVSVDRQICYSQVVLLNKTDLIPEEKQQDILTAIEDLHPGVKVYPCVQGKVDLNQLLLEAASPESTASTNREDNRPYVAVLELNKPVSPEAVKGLVEEMMDYFIRMKGCFRWEDQLYILDTVQGDLQLKQQLVQLSEDKTSLVFISGVGISALSPLLGAAEKHLPGAFSVQG